MSQKKCTKSLGTYILPASVASATHSLAGFAHAVYYTPVYLACNYPTVLPVARHRLFFNIQVATLLLDEYTLFVRANLYKPTMRLHSYFSTIYLRVYTAMKGYKRSFNF